MGVTYGTSIYGAWTAFNVNSLYGKRYVGYMNDNPDFFATATLHGDVNTTTSINSFQNFADNYSWQWLGFFKTGSAGTYTFYTTSDDCSFMWIGDTAISGFTTANALVNNAGTHGSQERSGSITLAANTYYPIRIQYGESGSNEIMTLSFAGPNISKTTNGVGYYYGGRYFYDLVDRGLLSTSKLNEFLSRISHYINPSLPNTYYPATTRVFSTSGLLVFYDTFNNKATSYSGSGTTLTDISGNGYNGTIVNSPTYSNGIFTFNSASSHDIYVNSSFNNPTTFTINRWFKTTQSTNKIMGFENSATGSSSGYDRSLYLGSTGLLYFGVYNGAVQTVNSSVAYNDGNWHLATGYCNAATGKYGLYVDGAFVAEGTANPQNYTGYWRISGSKIGGWTGAASDSYFGGDAGQVAIYSTALSAAEILDNYNNTKTNYGL